VKDGAGCVSLGSGAFEGPYSFGSRFEKETGTNPEELLGAAHASCFSMALSLLLTEAGYAPTQIRTLAKVSIERSGNGFAITHIDLLTVGDVPGLDPRGFAAHAEAAKANCPVSKALTGVEISLTASLAEQSRSIASGKGAAGSLASRAHTPVMSRRGSGCFHRAR